MFTWLKNWWIKKSCEHSKECLKTVAIQDRYFDYMTDNDDLDDFPTILEIVYCSKCGKIISNDIVLKYGVPPFLGGCTFSSSYEEQEEFFRVTGATEKSISHYGLFKNKQIKVKK